MILQAIAQILYSPLRQKGCPDMLSSSSPPFLSELTPLRIPTTPPKPLVKVTSDLKAVNCDDQFSVLILGAFRQHLTFPSCCSLCSFTILITCSLLWTLHSLVLY